MKGLYIPSGVFRTSGRIVAPPERGSVLLYALVLMALCSLIFAGWVELLMARANFSGLAEESARARIAEANGDAILREAVLRQVVPSASGNLTSATTFQLPDGAGRAWIEAQWSGPPAAAAGIMPLWNPFSPGRGGGFFFTATGFVQNADGGTSPRALLVCSKSPALSGVRIAQTQAAVVSQTIDTNGGAFLRAPAIEMQADAAWFQVPDSATIPPFFPLNFPWLPGGGVSDAAIDTLAATAVSIPAGNGTLTLDLSTLTYSYSSGGNGSTGSFSNPARISGSGPVEITGSSADSFRLYAGAGATLSASTIGIRTAGNVWIVLDAQSSVTINATANPAAVITARGTALDFAVGSVFRGGIRTDSNVTGTASISPLAGFSPLEEALDRVYWIESYSAAP